MIFHMMVSVSRFVKIWNSPQFPTEYRNGQLYAHHKMSRCNWKSRTNSAFVFNWKYAPLFPDTIYSVSFRNDRFSGMFLLLQLAHYRFSQRKASSLNRRTKITVSTLIKSIRLYPFDILNLNIHTFVLQGSVHCSAKVCRRIKKRNFISTVKPSVLSNPSRKRITKTRSKLNRRNLKTPSFRFRVHVDKKILKTELFENNDVTIIMWLPWPSFPQ